MIKHYCDLCKKEITSDDERIVDDVHLPSVIVGTKDVFVIEYANCEICMKCAETLVETTRQLQMGRGVVYVEKK